MREIHKANYDARGYRRTLKALLRAGALTTPRPNDHGILASIGTVGDAVDNALAESFVDTFKTELIPERAWPSGASSLTRGAGLQSG
jgi:hypothetical protein